MIIEQINTENGGKIALWHITESRDELLEMLNLDPFIMEQAFTFSSQKRQLEYLAVRAMYKTVTGKMPSIGYRENRVPFLEDGSGEISITHTGAYAAIYLHPTLKVGIDIERIGDKVMRVKNRFLSDDELSSIDARNEKTHLTILWAAKEALYKVMQQETVDFKEHLHINSFTPYLDGTLDAWESKSKNEKAYKIDYKVYPEFVLTWVSE